MKVPSLNYPEVVSAFQRAGWVVVRQKGSHIRMQLRTAAGIRKITVVAHKPIKRSALAKLLKSADISTEEFSNSCDKATLRRITSGRSAVGGAVAVDVHDDEAAKGQGGQVLNLSFRSERKEPDRIKT